MRVAGRSEDDELVEMIEIENHPWSLPASSTPNSPPRPRRAPAFQRVHRRGHRKIPGRSGTAERRNRLMRLCGFEVGSFEPLFLICGPLCRGERSPGPVLCAGAQGHRRRVGRPVHLQEFVRQGQPLLAPELSGPRTRRGAAHTGESAARSRCAGADRCARRHAPGTGGGGGIGAADAGIPVPSDRLHPAGVCARQAGEHQERPVPGAGGHAAGGRESPAPPATSRYWCASGA